MTPESEDYFRAPVHKIDTGNAVLALREFGPPTGAGPALLLVHGFPLHGYTWRKLLPQLSQRFTCYVPDLPGLGDSDWNAATDFDFTGHAANLAALLDRRGVQRFSLLAQDTGGTVARHLALRDPSRVTRLTLLNTEMPNHRPPWIVEYQHLLKVPGAAASFRLLLRSRIYLRSRLAFGGAFCNLDLIDGEFTDAFLKPCIESARRTDGMTRYLKGATWGHVDSLAQRHAELTMPVQLLWGEDDYFFPVELARQMTPQFPHAEFVAVPKCKLLLHEERPDEVLRHALPFLAAG